MDIKFFHIAFGFGPLHNALQFLEAVCIVVHGLVDVYIRGGVTIRGCDIPQDFGGLDNWLTLDHQVLT